jgi:hypothetical protein
MLRRERVIPVLAAVCALSVLVLGWSPPLGPHRIGGMHLSCTVSSPCPVSKDGETHLVHREEIIAPDGTLWARLVDEAGWVFEEYTLPR